MGVAASTKGPSKERPHEGERRRLGRMQTSADRGGTREGGKEGGRDGGREGGRERGGRVSLYTHVRNMIQANFKAVSTFHLLSFDV